MSVALRINNCQVLNIKILWSGIGLFNFLTWLHLGKIAAAVVLTQPQSGAFQKVVCTNYLLLTNYHYLALTTKILEKYAAVQFAEIEVIWEIMIEWHNEIYCEIYSYIYWDFYDLICHQVPLARSEGNLLELMERVCERMEDYGEHTDSSTNRKSYIRVKSRSGEAMDLSETTLDSRVTASLKFAVSTIFCVQPFCIIQEN